MGRTKTNEEEKNFREIIDEEKVDEEKVDTDEQLQLITIADYANRWNVSYEAIRKQVNNYADELGEHVRQIGKNRFLDQYAVEFLNEKRRVNPTIIKSVNKEEEITFLKAEAEKYKELYNQEKEKANNNYTLYLEESKKIIAIEQKNGEEINKIQQEIYKEKEAQLNELCTLRAENKTKDNEIQRLSQLLQEERDKSIFQRIFGKKMPKEN